MANTYTTYKDSGIPWIGEIPENWRILRLKNILKCPLQYGANESGIPYKENLPRYVRITDICDNNLREDLTKLSLTEEQADGYILNDNDLLFARSGATVGKSFLYRKAFGRCAFAGYLIKAIIQDSYPQFVYYYTQSSAYEEWKRRIFIQATIQNIGADRYSLMELPIPPLDTQESIINFLDEKCSEIDELISLQEKMIDELKAYKKSVITEAVTKGLDRNVKMKDSGVDWIGEIPEHWETRQFKWLFSIKKDIAGKLGYDVLSVTQKGIKIKDLSKNEGQIAQDYSKYQLVNPNDFVMNHMDLLTGYVDCSKYNGVTSPDYRVFHTNNESSTSLAYYLRIFQLCYSCKIFYGLGQGVSGFGRWRLPAEQQKLFYLPYPPYTEQQEIASFLDTKCSEIDSLISIKEKKIEELKDYKKSLIYEYVTGKKRVV